MKDFITHYVIGLMLWTIPVISFKIYEHAMSSLNFWWVAASIGVSVIFWSLLDFYRYVSAKGKL